MLILLPPSEGKTGARRRRPVDPASLSFPQLSATRDAVRAALTEVSASPDAPALLGVSAGLLDDIARNLSLGSAPAAAAGQVYTGVLYDALGYGTLETAAKRRANRWIVIVSALWGAVRPTDRIPPYRLSMGVALPGVGPLAAAWRPALSQALPDLVGEGLIVDARSSTYAAAWSPVGAQAERWVHIAVPGATHMAKQTRGQVTRTICELGLDPRRPHTLAEGLATAFDVTLAPPAKSNRPWTLAVRP